MLGEVITAIVTPFDAEGNVDVDAFQRLARHLVDHGSDGLVVAGTTGESPTLSDEEKLELFAAAKDAVGDRATIIAGTGTYDTRHSAELTRRADPLGVDGFLVVTPYYNKPPQRAIVRHFQEIAAETDKPLMAYNIPARVVIDIEPATIAKLAEIDNVVAVKQAHDDLDEARFIAQETRLDLYSGDDNITLDFLELGGVGVVSVIAHVWARARWDDYQVAYAEALRRCDTDAAPWFVVPADRKWYRDWAVAHLLAETFDALDLGYPPADFDVERERERLRRQAGPVKVNGG